MSLIDSSAIDSVQHRSSSKRKLEDYSPSDDETVSDRMKKGKISSIDSSFNANQQLNNFSQPQSFGQDRVFDANSIPSCSNANYGEPRETASVVQFFVKLISTAHDSRCNDYLFSSSNCNTLVLRANLSDPVSFIHEKIQEKTGIPANEQRLIYKGKQLQLEKSLEECSIQNDAGLQLLGRMRSTEFPYPWLAIDNMISDICRLCRNELSGVKINLQDRLSGFFTNIPIDCNKRAERYLKIFVSSSAPSAIVMLYMSPYSGNKNLAENMIRYILDPLGVDISKHIHTQFSPTILEFCKLLRQTSIYDDSLYPLCRSTLGSMMEAFCIQGDSLENFKPLFELKELFPFVSELERTVHSHLAPSLDSPMQAEIFRKDFLNFAAFLLPLRTALMEVVKLHGPISMSSVKGCSIHNPYTEEGKVVHVIYNDLLGKMDKYLQWMDLFLDLKEAGVRAESSCGFPVHFSILKELNALSKIFLGAEDQFWTVMRRRSCAVCHLIMKCAKRSEDNQWLLEHKGVLDFECRRHLVMMMFAEENEDYEEIHEMLIDRSQLLAESFEYIAHAESLHNGLLIEFKNEEATGPGVLREWFFLLCQEIFDPRNALFVASQNDRRRFYPNPASKVDPLHLEYFMFAGRVIALALMHKVQVGIVFDRVFFLQLAGMRISLEDIRDADPRLYSSFKEIMTMDADLIDTDVLGLTFVREIEELGSRKTIELCPGGKNMVVNSKNRGKYIDLFIQHNFVTSISDQVSHFSQGFADILLDTVREKMFFKGLELEDLDRLLRGSETGISVEDWKVHTEYNGYKETDLQISWFWKIVEKMSPEQRNSLLFFWTSIQYLPVGGFHDLASRLYIYKTTEPHDRLPSSHTCFFRLCFPAYPSIAIMQDRLNFITQKHVSSSFGTW